MPCVIDSVYEELKNTKIRELNIEILEYPQEAKDSINVTAIGAISPEEVRERLAKDPDSGYDGIDIEEMPEIDEENEDLSKNTAEIPEKDINLASDEIKWITVKPNGEEGEGRHLPLNDGETPAEAMKRG